MQQTNMGDQRRHKQTFETVLRTCLEQGFIIGDFKKGCFIFIKKDDLSILTNQEANRFLTYHQEILIKNNIAIKESYDKEELRRIVPGFGRLLIGCVTENFSPYRDQALRLVKSIRWFGGKVAGADICVCVVDKVDQKFAKELEKWGAYVRVVRRFSKAHPPSNKLRLFELPEIQSYDTIMFLDCDTIILQDPAPYIDGYHLQAEFEARASTPHPLFKRIFSQYNLPLPKRKYRTSTNHVPTIWYCNTGVLIFPQSIINVIYPEWKKYTKILNGRKDLLGKHYFFCEQASFTLAYVVKPVPFKKLPMEMNFHLWSGPRELLRNYDPVIVHYHKRVNKNGFIRRLSPSQAANKRIRKFNQMLRREQNKK